MGVFLALNEGSCVSLMVYISSFSFNPLDHLEWPILGKLLGFYGCLLLDPWMFISYQVRAIGRRFKVRVFSV